MRKSWLFWLALGTALTFPSAHATDFKPEVRNSSYQHDKYGTEPKDIFRPFRAYVTSFDSDDDDDGDGKSDIRGIPEWVAYEMRQVTRRLAKAPARPSPWITDLKLHKAGIAPGDETYQYPLSFRKKNKNWYVRGHLAMKEHAWRLGAAADWNTHTVLNAVPQRNNFNSGIWLDLEIKTADWADSYEAVWIIAGPVFKNRKPTRFLGEEGELTIAIPDALFKIVVKESANPNRPDTLAVIYEQDCKHCKSQKGPFDHEPYLKTIQQIEEQTGLRFFTNLPAADREAIKRRKTSSLWD